MLLFKLSLFITEFDHVAIPVREDLFYLPSCKRTIGAWEADERPREGQAGENTNVF